MYAWPKNQTDSSPFPSWTDGKISTLISHHLPWSFCGRETRGQNSPLPRGWGGCKLHPATLSQGLFAGNRNNRSHPLWDRQIWEQTMAPTTRSLFIPESSALLSLPPSTFQNPDRLITRPPAAYLWAFSRLFSHLDDNSLPFSPQHGPRHHPLFRNRLYFLGKF